MGRIVVIVTYGHADDIGACLDALGGERVVVVDNASIDGTADRVAELHPWVELIRSPRNIGFARAVNLGMRLADHDDVFVLNPDVVVQADTIDRLAAVLAAHPQDGIVAPRLRHPDGSIQDSARSFKTLPTLLARRTPLGRTRWGTAILRRHLAPAFTTNETPVDWALGAALYVRRSALEAVGQLDPRFFLYEEDVDWCARMWAAGWGVRYVPSIEAIHGYRRDSRHTWDLRRPATRHHWASILRFVVKHPTIVLLGRSPRDQARRP